MFVLPVLWRTAFVFMYSFLDHKQRLVDYDYIILYIRKQDVFTHKKLVYYL